VFFSNAAGFPEKNSLIDSTSCIVEGLKEISDTMLAFQLWWPKEFTTEKVDS
jgi:hypothetical protein